jgi:TolB protein
MDGRRAAASHLGLLAAGAAALCFSAFAVPARAAFPGENGKIAFTRWAENSCAWPQIYTVNADGADETNLTGAAGGQNTAPDWSPDGAKIAFASNRGFGCRFQYDVYTMNSDGSSQTRVGSGGLPSWSPDGTRIAFAQQGSIKTMNADGSGIRTLTSGSGGFDDGNPAWSPDGTRIAFDRQELVCDEWENCIWLLVGIFVINADGTNLREVVHEAHGPVDWSPDGSKLVFGGGELWTVHPDGSNKTALTQFPTSDKEPAFSPDGRKIVFARGIEFGTNEIYVINADGSGERRLTFNSVEDRDPHWQSLLRGYPRPQAGALLRVPLAIAYEECAAGADNRTHGPALSAPSCNPARPASAHLAVGTLDANAKSVQAVGKVKYVVCVAGTTAGGECSTPAGMSSPDVRVEASLTDVRLRDGLADYTGELQVTQTLRITDKQNSPAPPNGTSGTVSDLPISYTAPCTPTPGPPDLGASCGVLTRMNALFPGSVLAGKRSNWEISQVQVLDGGPDGLVSTSPNTVFAREGIFVP